MSGIGRRYIRDDLSSAVPCYVSAALDQTWSDGLAGMRTFIASAKQSRTLERPAEETVRAEIDRRIGVIENWLVRIPCNSRILFPRDAG
jgi:hypothetical protein